MKRDATILTFAAAAALGIFIALPDPAPVNPSPLPFWTPGKDQWHWNIQYPDEFFKTNYEWVFEVASNLDGPWYLAQQERVDGTNGVDALVHLNGASFIHLRGIVSY